MLLPLLLLLQIVYVAPMKALAAEVTANFGKRLAPLGLVVRELTGIKMGLGDTLCCAVVISRKWGQLANEDSWTLSTVRR